MVYSYFNTFLNNILGKYYTPMLKVPNLLITIFKSK